MQSELRIQIIQNRDTEPDTVGRGKTNSDSDSGRSKDSGDFIWNHDKNTKCCKIPPKSLNGVEARNIILHLPGVKGDSKPVMSHFRMFQCLTEAEQILKILS
jgi:hypothetical protein